MMLSRVTTLVLTRCFSFFLYFFSVIAYAETEYYQTVDSEGQVNSIYSVHKNSSVYSEKLYPEITIEGLNVFPLRPRHDYYCIEQDHYSDDVKVKWAQLAPDGVYVTDTGKENSDSLPLLEDEDSDSAPENTSKCRGILSDIWWQRDIPGYALLKKGWKQLDTVLTDSQKPGLCLGELLPGHTDRQPVTIKKAAINDSLFKKLGGKIPVWEYIALIHSAKRLYAGYYSLDILDSLCCYYSCFCAPFLCAMGHGLTGLLSGMYTGTCDAFYILQFKKHYKKLLKFTAINVAIVVNFDQDNDTLSSEDYASDLLASINASTSKLLTHFAGIIDFDYLPELQVTDQGRIVMIMRLNILDNEFDQSDLTLRLLSHQKNLKDLEKENKKEAFYIPLFINRNDQLIEVGKLLGKSLVINKQPQPGSVGLP